MVSCSDKSIIPVQVGGFLRAGQSVPRASVGHINELFLFDISLVLNSVGATNLTMSARPHSHVLNDFYMPGLSPKVVILLMSHTVCVWIGCGSLFPGLSRLCFLDRTF